MTTSTFATIIDCLFHARHDNRIILFSATEIIEQQRQTEHRASDRTALLIHRLFGFFF